MSRQPTPKRRRKKTAAARLRPFWLLVFLALALAAVLGYMFVTWPALRPRTIVVEGTRMVTKDQVLNAAAINPESNMWLQNTHAMAARIDAIPYVLDAAVHREPPATIKITVTERKPFAELMTHDGPFLIDRDLRVLQPVTASSGLLPLMLAPQTSGVKEGQNLEQPDIVSLRNDALALANARIDATKLEHDRFGDLVVTLRDGVRVLFGDESDLTKKIPLVDPILTQVGRQKRAIAAIDLRAPNTPVVVYKK